MAIDHNLKQLAEQIKSWGSELGFSHIGICDIDLKKTESQLNEWLGKKFHGEMEYMSTHGIKRTRPDELVPGTIRIITARMDYLNESMEDATKVLESTNKGYISRYALGRDYHKVIRSRLQKLATKITTEVGPTGYRVFCDSAPVMEKALAEKSGQGWLGKHSNIINRENGSWFFLGELYTDIPLPIDSATTNHCGSCSACIDVCPTQAIVAPYQVDARRCISYHTIELHGPIPVEFRKAMGNRIYGCDDCQLVCPWNRYAKLTVESDFQTRHDLNDSQLIDLFAWNESTFLKNTEGSPIRRIGHQRWLRNIAVALGNAPTSPAVIFALKDRLQNTSELVVEHVQWALDQHQSDI
jgi:epoxyqueuosine reductase